MPIKSSELPGLPITRHGPSERIPAVKGETNAEGLTRYVDWMEDDTDRDPTPANKRREQQMNETYPKDGTGPDFSGRMAGLEKGPLKQ